MTSSHPLEISIMDSVGHPSEGVGPPPLAAAVDVDTEENGLSYRGGDQHILCGQYPLRIGRKGFRPANSAPVDLMPIPPTDGLCRPLGDLYIQEPASNRSLIDKDKVQKFLDQFGGIETATECNIEPGVLKVQVCFPVEMGLRTLKHGGSTGPLLYGDRDKPFYICGLCCGYFSSKRRDCIRHTNQCENARRKKASAAEGKKEKNRLYNLKYRKRKAQQKALDKPLKRRKRDADTDTDHTNRGDNVEEPVNLVDNDSVTPTEKETTDVDTDGEDMMEQFAEPEENSSVFTARNTQKFIAFPGIHSLDILQSTDLEFLQLQKCEVKQANYIYSVWKPDDCPKQLADQPCNIQLKGERVRLRFLAFPLPGKLSVRQLYCTAHRHTFNALSVIDALPDNVVVTPDVVVRKNTIMSRDFYNFVITEFELHTNVNRIYLAVQNRWQENTASAMRNLAIHARAMKDCSTETPENPSVAMPSAQEQKVLHSLHPQLICSIILDWWYTFKEVDYLKKKEQYQIESSRLSGDHTYKIAKGLGVYKKEADKKRVWLPVKASLFSLINQEGHVVDFKICPDDTLEHVIGVLEAVWSKQIDGGHALANIYISDNITKEKNFVQEAFDRFAVTLSPSPRLTLAQDLWHAYSRVATTLVRGAKQYFKASRDLKILFSKIKKKVADGGYARNEDVCISFQEWCNDFMKETDTETVDEKTKLKLVGESLCGQPVLLAQDELVVDEVEEPFLFLTGELQPLVSPALFQRAQESCNKLVRAAYFDKKIQGHFRSISSPGTLYEVNLCRDGDDCTIRCSCPVSFYVKEGEWCKHAAALVLKWNDQRDLFHYNMSLAALTVNPGPYYGVVSTRTIPAINRILSKTLPHLMVLKDLTDNRGTTLNENWHGYINRHAVHSGGTKSMALLEVQLKVLHLRYNSEKKTPGRTVSALVDSFTDLLGNDDRLPEIQRKIYPHNKDTTTIDGLKISGFKTKDGRELWNEEEKKKVVQALKDYANSEIDIHTADPYYYISHHILAGSKDAAAVKKFLKSKYNI